MGSRRLAVLVGWVLALGVALPAASASAAQITETPPNDNIAQAFGPLASGVVYDGTFETVNDKDWLFFFVGGAKQVQVRVTKVGAGCGQYIGASLRDANGIVLQYDNFIESNTTRQFDFTTTTAGRFYVSLGTDCAGDPYQVQVGPPDAITTAAPASDEPPVPAPQATSEPNDSIATASGPLGPNVAYGGDFSAVNDRDWLVFYTTGAVQTRVRVTKVGAGCGQYIGASVRDANGMVLQYDNFIASNTTRQFDFTTTTAGRFYVSLATDCAGDPYQVRVGPPEAIAVDSPLAAFAPSPNPAATTEPNDTPDQATRILGGTAYGAAIDTVNDIDLFRFAVAAGRQVDVAVTKIGDGCGTSLDTAVFNASAGVGGSVFSGPESVGRNETAHHQFTSNGTEEYLLRVTGTCPGGPYQVRIDPADAVLAGIPVVVVPPDGDRDGTPDATDACPSIPGPAPSGCPPPTRPRTMTLQVTPLRERRPPFRFAVRGSVLPPGNLPQAPACAGTVTIRLVAAGRTVARSTAAVSGGCTYSGTLRLASRRGLGRAARLRVSATFSGNRVLLSAYRQTSVRIR